MNEELQDELGQAHLASAKDFVEYCNETHAATVADELKDLDTIQVRHLLLALDPRLRAEIFGHLGEEMQVELAESFRSKDLAQTLQFMSPDERADFYQALPQDLQEIILPLLARAQREDLLRLHSYEDGTAGAVMTSDYATLSPQLTAREAIEQLRQEAPDRETIYNSYVIDEERKLIGVVGLRSLIVSPSFKKVADIMETEVISALVDESQEDVAKKIAKFDLLAIPVLDQEGHLLGIVTVDDVLDVAQEEATEDFHLMGSVQDVGMSLREASAWLLVQKRLPWLLVLVLMNVFSGAGIAYFEDVIQATVALVFFLPLLIDSGGNAGSQSATLMVRALATGDVTRSDWLSLLGREVLIALAIGLMMALAVSLLGFYRGGPDVALVVSSAMILVVLTGSLIGMSLPFLLSKFDFDPATASAPLVTSIADIAGVLIYFSIATAWLH